MDIYEVMWFVVIGSFLGYLIETLWYKKIRGRWICRKGVIYGLYSPIYGIALAFFSKIFFGIKNKFVIFICGSVIGSVFEYLCGFLQEKILHTKSWDYSNKKFQLHGRICLEFAIYWGFLAVIIIEIIKPILHGLYMLISVFFIKFIVLILFVLFVIDCVISILACLQQRNRREYNQIKNKFTDFLDRHYSDERLAKIFTEIRFL